MSTGKGETAALPRAGHSAHFSISGRHSAIEKGSMAAGAFTEGSVWDIGKCVLEP